MVRAYGGILITLKACRWSKRKKYFTHFMPRFPSPPRTDLDGIGRGDQHVGGLHVPVQDARLMQRLDAAAGLERKGGGGRGEGGEV